MPTSGSEHAHIFPTAHRDKHGKTISFPIGAEKLSRLLDGVPQHAAITCNFYAADMQRRPMRDVEHVLHAVYSRQQPSNHFAASAAANGVFDPRWNLTVFAVPGTIRFAVRQRLEPAIVAHVKPWLIDNAECENRFGQAGLTIEYNTVDGTLIVETTDKRLPARV